MTKEKIRILLVEDNLQDVAAMRSSIALKENLELVAVASSSSRAKQLTEEYLPDVVILDLELESGDGLDYAEWVGAQTLPVLPYVVVTTYNSNPAIWDRVRATGLGFIFAKKREDYTAARVVKHLLEMSKYIKASSAMNVLVQAEPAPPETREEHLRKKIQSYLAQFGVSTSLDGQDYIEEGLVYMAQQHKRKPHMEKEFYPAVATLMSTSPANVEKSIRYSISVMFNNPQRAMGFYKGAVSENKGAPTNRNFLLQLARDLDIYVFHHT